MRCLGVVALVLAACHEPHYTSGSLQCAASGRACPDGFHCNAGRCWAKGDDPDFAVPDDLAGADLAGLDLARSDLAQTDAGGPDMAHPASLCSSVSALVCDGFEEGSLNARWMVNTSHGTITVDSSRSYRGAYSLHAHSDAIASSTFDPGATVRTSQGFSTLSAGTIYVRAFAFMSSPAPMTFNQILNFADSAGNGIAAGTVADGHMVVNDYTSAGWGESSTVTLPTNRWTCLQFDIPIGMTGTTHLFVDGSEVTDARVVKASPQPIPEHIYCGLDWSATVTSQPAGDLWLDEILVDNKPTSCTE